MHEADAQIEKVPRTAIGHRPQKRDSDRKVLHFWIGKEPVAPSPEPFAERIWHPATA
jgi:hypothetical protein